MLAYALALLDRGPAPPTLRGVVQAMAAAQAERTPRFLSGLSEQGFAERFLAAWLGAGAAESDGAEPDGAGRSGAEPDGEGRGPGTAEPGDGGHLGATTHISVLDPAGCACSVTCSNGEGSGVVVPQTGMHLNNMMGEQDLNPLGFHRHPAGRRMPSMMAPTVVMRGGEVELVLGSAGSNRIRSALLQTIIGVVDHSMGARAAVDAPRVHFEDGVLYAEPGVPLEELHDLDISTEEPPRIVQFGSPNLFFGGVQAVERRPGERPAGAGDPRRGGVAVNA